MRWLSAPFWLQTLQDYAKSFDEKRWAFRDAVLVVTANKAERIYEQAQSNERKLDAILTYLQGSPRSQLQAFLGMHDGETILNDKDGLLQEAKQYFEREKDGEISKGADPDDGIEDYLQQSSRKFWDNTIQVSTRTFEATLKTLKKHSKEQGDRIIREIRRGTYQEIGDPVSV